MRKISFFLLLSFIALVFAGCPYESAVPIDKPSQIVNRLLLGSWTMTDEQGTPVKFVVTKVDNYNYKIVENDGKQTLTYTGFVSKVGEVLYLNVKASTDAGYSFAKLDFNTNASQLTVSFISDELKEKFNSSAELKEYILKNQLKENFFDAQKLVLNQAARKN
jgi:hypothetical protein